MHEVEFKITLTQISAFFPPVSHMLGFSLNYYYIQYRLLSMLKPVYVTSISTIWKELTSILPNLNNFHSLEVVDRVSETQLQVGEN